MKMPGAACSNRKSILRLILVAMLATVASGCGHLLDYALFSPYITTEKLPNGTVGVAYDGKVNANSDLGADWWISGGQLPPGLEFRDSHISGTPTAGGRFTFEVTVSTGSTNVPDTDSKRFTVLRATKEMRGSESGSSEMFRIETVLYS